MVQVLGRSQSFDVFAKMVEPVEENFLAMLFVWTISLNSNFSVINGKFIVIVQQSKGNVRESILRLKIENKN